MCCTVFMLAVSHTMKCSRYLVACGSVSVVLWLLAWKLCPLRQAECSNGFAWYQLMCNSPSFQISPCHLLRKPSGGYNYVTMVQVTEFFVWIVPYILASLWSQFLIAAGVLLFVVVFSLSLSLQSKCNYLKVRNFNAADLSDHISTELYRHASFIFIYSCPLLFLKG